MNIKDITIVIPTSVIPSHPDTTIIDETIKSIRYHFPDNEIILQVDGLRNEQSHRKDSYDEYKNRLLWKCLHEYVNVLPIIFEEHSHQSTMMKNTIDLVTTSLILYVEADMALRTDREIEWSKILDLLEDQSKANTVRIYLKESIPNEHQYLMRGIENGFMRTIQWSQTPHISRTEYYRKIVLPAIGEKTYIEDEFYKEPKNAPWVDHKLWIYYPNDEKGLSRAYHLDGRKGIKKFTSDDDAWGLTEL
jgi:hypothetical protein